MTASVVLFGRKARPDATSIEHVFDVLAPRLGERFDVTYITSPYANTGFVPRAMSAWWARRHQARVNHVLGDTNFFVLGLDPARTVLTVHDCEFMERNSGMKALVYEWMWLKLPVRRAAIVTVPSVATRDELHRYTGARNIRVVPNPVDPRFKPSERQFVPEQPVILQVGARSNKNLERTAHALEGIPCTFVVVGLMTDEQRKLCASLRIDLIDAGPLSTQQVVERYRSCDLVTFASTKEGFGLPIVEAQASGRPVVTSNLAPMSEIAGDGACLVDPFDVASIRAGIQRVISNAMYRRELVDLGLRNVERFQPDVIAKTYGDIYEELL